MESQSPEQVDVVPSAQEEEEVTDTLLKEVPQKEVKIRCQKCRKEETISVPSVPVNDLEPFIHYAMAIEEKGWFLYFEERGYNALFARVYYRCSACRLVA